MNCKNIIALLSVFSVFAFANASKVVSAAKLEGYSTELRPDYGWFKRKFLVYFDENLSKELRNLSMPFAKKYIDRADLREELDDVEISNYANDLLKKYGVKNKKVLVVIAQDNDPVFVCAKGAAVVDLVSQYLIIIQRDFVKNYSRDIVKAVVCHEVGHVVQNDILLRYAVNSFATVYQLSLLFLVVVFLLFYIPRRWWLIFKISFASWIVIVLLYGVFFAQWSQSHEFRADSFAVKECGLEKSLEMLNALSEVAPEQPGFFINVFTTRLFGGHPSLRRRIAAMELLAKDLEVDKP